MGNVQELKSKLQEMKLKYDNLKDRSFMLDMKDTWNDNDFRLSDNLHDEMRMCKEVIADIEHQLMFEVTEDD